MHRHTCFGESWSSCKLRGLSGLPLDDYAQLFDFCCLLGGIGQQALMLSSSSRTLLILSLDEPKQ